MKESDACLPGLFILYYYYINSVTFLVLYKIAVYITIYEGKLDQSISLKNARYMNYQATVVIVTALKLLTY